MSLSLRLQTIYDMVPRSAIADIGSDHGKLIIELARNGLTVEAYAVENKKGPYDRLCKEIEKAGLMDKITPLFSDGLTDLPSYVGTLIIAGMGGGTIIKILNDHLEKLHHVQTIIIDAHTKTKEVRQFICKLGFKISEEKIVKEDDVFYEIIRFDRAESAFYSEEDYEYGPILREEKGLLFIQKYEERINEIDALMSLANLPATRQASLQAEKNRLEKLIK